MIALDHDHHVCSVYDYDQVIDHGQCVYSVYQVINCVIL